MTLIVGVKCQDGIVLGADSRATYATSLGQPTIRQDTVAKLHIATSNSPRAIIALSGPIGLSQTYFDELDGYVRSHNNRIRWRNIQEAKTELTKMFWQHAKPAWERAGVVAQTTGQAAMIECNHASAVVFALDDTPHLIQFSPQCSSEEVTESLPFVSLGSGQVSADPFLAFIRRIFWPRGLPSLLDGKLATIWTLDEVIQHNPSGVGGEINIAALAKDVDGQWKCSLVPPEEIATHRQALAERESRMRETSVPLPEPMPEPPGSE